MTQQSQYQPSLIDISLRDWICGINGWNTRKNTKRNQTEEYSWSQDYFKSSTTHQWSNKFGEKLVEYLLKSHNENSIPVRKYMDVLIGNFVPNRPIVQRIFNRPVTKFKVDLETDNFIVEVKTRNWSTTGTAGDKIYCTPFKYWNLPKLYNKPLIIVLVGYMEYEAKYKMGLWDDNHDGNRQLLEVCARNNIYYIGASDLLKNDLNLNFYLK